MKQRFWLWSVLALLGGIGVWQLGNAALIAGKAWLAPILIHQAWDKQIDTGEQQRPWPWADFHPGARLTMARLDIDQFILDDPSARSLAFGPVASGLDNAPVLFGHRDTHFRFLRDIRKDDLLRLETAGGNVRHYQVTEMISGNVKDIMLSPSEDGSQLVLVTCYPFDALLAGGPGRYVVLASEVIERVSMQH
ncbi:sortase domain-containing protein [Aestuariispira insulae]|uniref:Sortase A n=1 Tax=Aestuariispira insulae TaxID=1461337 RepID=A0A3D9HWI0_9PROT|nr:sortase [Aestuariispira insulae]RED53837.1 sortase A [Aestuariispira insulae]